MNWTQLLKSEVETTYGAAAGLLDQVTDADLSWKPATGSNWMTVAQLIFHVTGSCGKTFECFVTGNFGMPDGVDMSELSPEEMLPPAEALPAAESVDHARKLLAEDKALILKLIAEVGEERLATEMIAAPWDPVERSLGHQALMSLQHLLQHRGQLFYYLKLQGKPVNTIHLWGM